MKTIVLSVLKEQINAGWKKPQLAEHYELPVAQITKLLQQAGLQIRRFQKPQFILQDDTVENTPTVETPEVNLDSSEANEIVQEVEPQETTEEPVTVAQELEAVETPVDEVVEPTPTPNAPRNW